jgi:hypothetical protein
MIYINTPPNVAHLMVFHINKAEKLQLQYMYVLSKQSEKLEN